MDPVPDRLLLGKSGRDQNWTRTSRSVARNSDYWPQLRYGKWTYEDQIAELSLGHVNWPQGLAAQNLENRVLFRPRLHQAIYWSGNCEVLSSSSIWMRNSFPDYPELPLLSIFPQSLKPPCTNSSVRLIYLNSWSQLWTLQWLQLNYTYIKFRLY
jgi:hypothetical protein